MRRLLSCLLAAAAAGCAATTATSAARETAYFPGAWGTSPVTSAARAPAPARAAVPATARAVGAGQARPPYTTALVAVLELNNKLKGRYVDSVDAGYFSNAVRAALKQTFSAMRIMTRENIVVLLNGAGKSLSDCEGECEVDTGRRLGADLVVSGELLTIGSLLKLDLRMHETRDGQLVNGVAASGKTPEELDANTRAAVETLLAPLR